MALWRWILIPKDFITEWRQTAPWIQDAQVEQDLAISRALVEIFSHPDLNNSLAFRGGTALFKLHLPPVRYSEDIDLVQVDSAPIGQTIDALRSRLDGWLGIPKRKSSEGRVTLLYRFDSEDGLPLRLKVEINTREHFSIYGFKNSPFSVDCRWYSGAVEIQTYDLDELLGTKLRALYQRKKGRDLFDLWYAFYHADPLPKAPNVVEAFLKYMQNEEHHITRAVFEQNLKEKKSDPVFSGDIGPLLAEDTGWDFDLAIDFLAEHILHLLPGEAWKG